MAASNGLTKFESGRWLDETVWSSDGGLLWAANDQSPDLDPIVRRILFSKHFVPTYYAVLLLVIVICSISRWLSLRRYSNEGPGAKCEFGQPKHVHADIRQHGAHKSYIKGTSIVESTPLLSQELHGDEVSDSRNSIYRWIKSWLIYQPRPILALTAPVNVLPSNDVSLIAVFLIALNIFYLFYRNVPPACGLDAFAVRAGLCCVMNIPVIYVLAAKNNFVLVRSTGWSYEGLNIFHRRLAEWICLLAFIHAFCMLGVWYTSFIPRGFTWTYFFKIRLVILGICSLLCFVILAATSIGHVRRKAYELFLAVHVTVQAIVLVLLFFHHPNTRWYTGLALCVWLVDRIAIRIFVSPKKYIANLQLDEDEQTVLIYIDIPLSSKGHLCNIEGGWLAGQHVYLSVPSLGFKYRYQRHPFTIASPAPPAETHIGGRWPLQLIVRGKNGFSQKLTEFAKHHQHVEVLLDGPYGSSAALQAIQRAKRVFLVAGGSGISVTHPLAWTTQNSDGHTIINTRTTYKHGRKHVPRVSISRSLESEHFCHIWVNKTNKHSSWITLLPADAGDKQGCETAENGNHCDMAKSLVSKTISTCGNHDNRPDVCAELSNWLRNSESHHSNKSSRVCVVVSGPDELARDVRNSVSAFVREGWNIDIVVEKFNW